MKKLLLLTALFVAASFSACEYDDGEIWDSFHGLEDRVVKLEELCKQMNTNISSMKTIVDALQTNDYVTGVAPVSSNGKTVGYTISFTKSAPITIYHGKDGTNGIDGKDGKDGKDGTNGTDGHTPVIGVRQDSDGIYYWTLDGDWLLDSSNNKIKAEGRDGQNGDGSGSSTPGKDGITPQLKIENGDWYVSTDNGTTWTNLGKATGADGKDGKDGDSMFKSVTHDSDYAYFTLADGDIIKLPKEKRLAITFDEGDEFFFDPDQTITVHYTITGNSTDNVVKAEMQNNDNNYTLYTTSTSATTGTIMITAKTPTANRVIVSVSDGTQTIMKAISTKPSKNIIHLETPGTLAELLADYDKDAITKLTVSGNLNTNDITTLKELPNLAVLDMGNADLAEEELPSYVFHNNQTLTSVILPKNLKRLGAAAFQGSKVADVTLPDGLSSIEESTFAGCKELTSIIIPGSVTAVKDGAFRECDKLISVTMLDGVTTIGSNAFITCVALETVSIPASVTSIGSYAFGWTMALKSIDIPGGVTKIEQSTFQNCSSLTTVNIANGVTTIGISSFHNCGSLTSITLPDSVTTIEDGAFNECSGITSITLGTGITSIGSKAFASSANLTSVYCKAQTPPTVANDTFNNAYGWTLYVPTGCKEAYQASEVFGQAREIQTMEF